MPFSVQDYEDYYDYEDDDYYEENEKGTKGKKRIELILGAEENDSQSENGYWADDFPTSSLKDRQRKKKIRSKFLKSKTSSSVTKKSTVDMLLVIHGK